ncbi:Z1 domain-containing protein [Pontibacter liquoris]|uniref:Z1 domain-containing protein n=1 Tax=Pontibacter liquoris TaxID=2905677 RepID=UPI001FA7E6B3|nr:Z1 domain-containing protein [Pontibacter liquoris]
MDQFESATNVCHIFLSPIKAGRSITLDDIINVVQNPLLKQQYPLVDEEELIAQLETDYEVYQSNPTDLTNKDVKPWLNDHTAGLPWELWKRYRSYIKMKDGSFPIDNLDDITDRILDKCVNPKTTGGWDRRGMVVGNVQSGKTANYTGLINKATDAGYKLIIVIAGVHNSLRSQTQVRIDEGYIGRNSADFIIRRRVNKIGVGEFKADTEIYSYTSSDEKGDFNRGIANKINVPIGGKSPTVLVIKKNVSVLENLILWLNQYAVEDSAGNRKIFDVPVLVIDDEADNASVNSGTEIDVRAINRLIRTLLSLFNQNTFIGYTATPYANLFIPSSWSEDLETMVKDVRLKVGEDLFPRDFIVNIPPPSNYIGAAQVFGFENRKTGEQFEGLDIIRPAEDQEPWFPRTINRNNRDQLPDDVPATLKEAIKAFILTCAIRRLRGHGKKHNSMLVHVALRVAWIDRVAWLVNEILRDFKRQIKSGQGNLMQELKELFENDFLPTTTEVLENLAYSDPKLKLHNWEDVSRHLIEAVSKIEVRAVHGTKNTRNLEYHNIEEINYGRYENGLSVIAVGGNKLARGITLEGLSVSYYLRTTRMYDSLMQMGRWFGYRPGYIDLCRLYTTEQLVNWYRHVTMATEEMRADFDEMAAKNLRPQDYQLKVRTHPGMLSITSVTKMREHERIEVGFSGKLIQTYIFDKSRPIVEGNNSAFNNLLNYLSNPELLESNRGVNALLWKSAGSDLVIDFISKYKSAYVRNDVLRAYIEQQNSESRLKEWSVAVILNSGKTITTKGALSGKPVKKHDFSWKDGNISAGLPARNLEEGLKELRVKGSKNAILDRRARMIDLDFDSEPTEELIKQKRNTEGRPLLVIMPLDPRVSSKLDENIPLIGFGLIFPDFEGEEVYSYAARPAQVDFEEVLQEDDDEQDEG